MRAIILAAGRGSRMGNLTENKPKGMVALAGKTLLEWQMHAIHNSGIKDIIIVRGYCGHRINYSDILYLDNTQWEKTNMLVSLLKAKEFLRKEECIISYADIVYNSNTVKSLIKQEGDITITYDLNWYKLWKSRFADPLADAETFIVDRDGILLEIGNKTKSLDKIQGQYMGLLKINPEGWKKIEAFLKSLNSKQIESFDMTKMLLGLISQKIKINTVPINEPWFEIDSEEDLNLYKTWMADPSSKYFKRIVKGDNIL